jgi:Mg2+-importing ATPase
MLDSRATSLTSGEAAARLARYGPNLAAATVRRGLAAKLIGRLSDPLIAILLIAAAISGATGDCQSFVIILVIILFSITLDIVQEYKAETAIEALKRSVAVTAALRRDGKVLELPVKDVVPGDVVELKVGDLVPADGVVLSGRDALVNEAILTGEPYPVEKRPGPSQGGSPADAFNALFGSTTIVGGETVMLVATTGRATRFGAIAASLQAKEPATAFERGIREARTDAAGAGSGERVGREEFLGKFEREVIKPIPRDARECCPTSSFNPVASSNDNRPCRRRRAKATVPKRS